MASADEEARHALWLAQRDKRVDKRMEIEEQFAGSPAALLALQARYQPLVNAHLDAQLPPTPDDIDSRVVINQDLNL